MPSGKRIKKQHSAIVTTFAKRLKTLRRERGVSQVTLALKAAVHISYIGRLERGESAAGIDTVEKLANALGVHAADLLQTTGGDKDQREALKVQVREHVELALKKADKTSLHALAIVASALARRA